ncbi:MAG: hypothetical protein KF805_17365, partial [Phycisphaeraceae bacterium]|nr:hypothetical protein [Phycisphaeraceae bacterium]
MRSESVSIVQVTGTIERAGLGHIFEHGGAKVHWTPGVPDGVVTLDLGSTREFGGVIGTFAPGGAAPEVRVETSFDGKEFESAGSIFVGASGRFYLPLRDTEAIVVRVRCVGGSTKTRLETIELAPLDFGATPNGMFARIASEQARGLFPRYLLSEQQYWTVVGVADDKSESLLSSDGAAEIDKEQFSVDPIVLPDGGEALTWANAKVSQQLAEGYLPLPSVVRDYDGLRLTIDAFAFGESGSSSLAVRYTVENTQQKLAKGKMLLALRPLQVNPPWQDLKTTGGFAPIDAIGVDSARDPIVIVRRSRPETVKTVQFIGGASEVLSSISDYGDAAIRILRSDLPGDRESPQEARRAMSAVVVCTYELKPGERHEWAAVSPFHGNLERVAGLGSIGATSIDLSLAAVRDEEEGVKRWWRKELNRTELKIPADPALENTFRTAQAHILINRDGPAIQPGSRTYERSWIRDGCLTSSALLATG